MGAIKATVGSIYSLAVGGIKRLPATRNRVTGSKKTFIIFHCLLDGEQFKMRHALVVFYFKRAAMSGKGSTVRRRMPLRWAMRMP